MRILRLTLLLLTAGSCATSGGGYQMSERTAARLAEFEKTGDIERCLNTTRINRIEPLDEYHLLFVTGANDYYLNEPRSGCSGAQRYSNRLQYTISMSQLCRGEIIDVVENSTGFVVGACSLNDFQELEKKPAEEPSTE